MARGLLFYTPNPKPKSLDIYPIPSLNNTIMKHFTKFELIKCYQQHKNQRCHECRLTAPAHTLPNGIEANLEALVDNVLDPARELLGEPIHVNSGFRCPLHNAAVGGVAKSQHTLGEAADITAGSPAENLKLARIIAHLSNYDQMILYVNNGSMEPQFIHVSWKRNGINRHRILKHVTGTSGYSAVTSL